MHLDFTAPGLSRRLNRILARMGHGVIEAKLNDLAERYGITWEEVNPAYSSQTCSNEHCGYVAKNNRKAQADFVCGACGHKIHLSCWLPYMGNGCPACPEHQHLGTQHAPPETVLPPSPFIRQVRSFFRIDGAIASTM